LEKARPDYRNITILLSFYSEIAGCEQAKLLSTSLLIFNFSLIEGIEYFRYHSKQILTQNIYPYGCGKNQNKR
jgi:hypothetical protein